MNKITIEYKTANGQSLTNEIMSAVLEVLADNGAECMDFRQSVKETAALCVPAFMERRVRNVR